MDRFAYFTVDNQSFDNQSVKKGCGDVAPVPTLDLNTLIQRFEYRLYVELGLLFIHAGTLFTDLGITVWQAGAGKEMQSFSHQQFISPSLGRKGRRGSALVHTSSRLVHDHIKPCLCAGQKNCCKETYDTFPTALAGKCVFSWHRKAIRWGCEAAVLFTLSWN